MAAPSLAIYNTNGNVVTGRSRTGTDGIGFWCKFKLSAMQDSPGGGQVSGWGEFDAPYVEGARFVATCIQTWADYPSDTLIKVWDDSGIQAEYDGVPTSEIADSASWTNADHKPCMRMCLFYQSDGENHAPMYYYLGSPVGVPTEVTPGGLMGGDSWQLVYPWHITDWEVECSVRMDSVEVVTIQQDDNDAGGFVWEEVQNKSGMGTTNAAFADLSHVPGIGYTADGLNINGKTANYYQNFEVGFTSAIELSLLCGLTGMIPILYPYQLYWPAEDPYYSAHDPNGIASPSKIAVCSAKCGTTQGDCHLPTNVPVYQAESIADGFSLLAKAHGGDTAWALTLEANGFYGDPAEDVSHAGSTIVWDDLGQSWQWQGALYAMDGAPVTGIGTPVFRDYATGQQWSGAVSPVLVRSGIWGLSPLYIGESAVFTPKNSDWSEAGKAWGRNEPGYVSHGLRLLNPALFNGGEDDTRCLIQYPRDKEVYSWALNDVTIDHLAVKSPTDDGLDGWTGINCTLAVVGGKLVATGVGADASIYRADFYTPDAGHPADDLWHPKHWPAHRFARILCDVTVEAGGASADWAGTLRVTRRHPNDGSTVRTFSTHKDIESGGVDIGARFDTCNPDERSGADTQQSYIQQCHPVQNLLIGTEADNHSVPDEAVPSEAWGIGCFDKVEILGLTAGNKYTFDLLGGVYVAETLGKRIYVERECKTPVTTGGEYKDDVEGQGQFFGGYQQVTFGLEPDSSPDACHKLYYDRQGVFVVNGKYGAEIASRYRWISANFETFTDTNIALSDSLGKGAFWPADDYSAWTLTRIADLFDSGWWDGTKYTTEDVLFAPDVCPTFWLCDLKGGSYGSGANVRDGSEPLYARPLYDFIQCGNWFGDGTGGETRAGHNTYRFIVKCRGRLHGLDWKNNLPPDEQGETGFPVVYASADGADGVLTDPVGYSQGYTYKSPAEARYPAIVECSPVRNRSWYRVCSDSVAQTTKPMGIVSSVRTGRTYSVLDIDGVLMLRIFDAHHPQYADRAIGVTVDSGGGIGIRQDRKDALRFVYEVSGDTLLIESTDEGKNWSSPVSVVASATYPQIAYNPVDGVEMVSYIRAGNACVKRNMGAGTWGAEIVVAAASADASAPLVPITDSRAGVWVCMVKNGSGDIDRYVSTDSGKTWAIG